MASSGDPTSLWLSWIVFPSGLEDGLSSYIFSLAILLAKGRKVALAPIYLRSLYEHLGVCFTNVTLSLGCYDVVAVDSVFLEMFL